MAINIENVIPVVQQEGLNSAKGGTLSGSFTFSGTNTFSGATGMKTIVKTAATTLTAADSGAICFFNSAAGDIYTLPSAAAGLDFTFVVNVTITSNAAKIITAASQFLLGSFIQSTDGTYTSAAHAANGTDIRSWNGNGTTTGGLIGDWIRVCGISATQWGIWGMGRATGSEATPFATS